MKYLLLLLLASACTLEQYEHDPYTRGQWADQPVVVICDDNVVNVVRILNQMDYWLDINTTYDYQYSTWKSCNTPQTPGTIRFRVSDPEYLREEGIAAYSKVTVRNEYIEDEPGLWYEHHIVDSATVYIHKTNSNQTLRHEIGHAFGWEHVFYPGHVMSPSSGDSTEGLEDYPPSF